MDWQAITAIAELVFRVLLWVLVVGLISGQVRTEEVVNKNKAATEEGFKRTEVYLRDAFAKIELLEKENRLLSEHVAVLEERTSHNKG